MWHIIVLLHSIKQHHLSNFENQLSLGPRKSSPSSQPKLKWQGGVDEFNPLVFGIGRNGTHHWNRMKWEVWRLRMLRAAMGFSALPDGWATGQGPGALHGFYRVVHRGSLRLWRISVVDTAQCNFVAWSCVWSPKFGIESLDSTA